MNRLVCTEIYGLTNTNKTGLDGRGKPPPAGRFVSRAHRVFSNFALDQQDPARGRTAEKNAKQKTVGDAVGECVFGANDAAAPEDHQRHRPGGGSRVPSIVT